MIGSTIMLRFWLTTAFVIVLGLLTFAASFAEVPRSSFEPVTQIQ